MESQIIELREAQSLRENDVGDYNINLSKPITINAGDEILLNKAFIDTQETSNQKIEIEADLTLQIHSYLYVSHWKNSGIFSSVLGDMDGESYFSCKKTNSGGIPSGHSSWTKWSAKRINLSKPMGNQKLNEGNIVYQYEDINGTTQFHTVHFPTLNQNSYIVDVNIIFKNDTLKQLVPSQTDKTPSGQAYLAENYNCEFEAIVDNTPPTNERYDPYISQMTIPLPKGSYEPGHLAKYITDKLSMNNINGLFTDTYGYLSSPFLKDSSNPDITGNTYIRANDTDTDYNFGSLNPHMLVGSSQIALEYDIETNRFKWSFLHLPMYDDNGNIIETLIVQSVTGDPFKYAWNSKAGGIAFQHLGAIDSNGNQTTFWTDKISMNLSTLYPPVKYVSHGTGIIIPKISCENGLQLTKGYNGLDSVITKSKDFYKLNEIVLKTSSGGTPSPGATDIIVTSPPASLIGTETIPIYGNDIFDEKSMEFGYFQIAIDTTFKQFLVNQDTIKKTIKGIVSRYNERGSYTSGTTDSGFIYIHRGEALELSSFNVRILDSNGNLANNIGSDNTIYLEVRKAVK